MSNLFLHLNYNYETKPFDHIFSKSMPDNIGQCLHKGEEYLCKFVDQCIPWNLVCNNGEDCRDGSDEGGLCLSSMLHYQ